MWLEAEHGVRASNGALWAAVDRLGLTYKKTLRAAEQDRPDVALRRRIWEAAQRFVDHERLTWKIHEGRRA